MILLVGVGVSTKGVANYLLQKKESFAWLSHQNELDQLPKTFWGLATAYYQPDKIDYTRITHAIISPGIKRDDALIQCIPLSLRMTDWELFVSRGFVDNKKSVGITGTNGKSTLVAQVSHILNLHGIKAAAVGNIGVSPFDHQNAEVYVVELSSFQLYHMQNAQFDIGCICNLAPDHQDWHHSINDYYECKRKLIKFSHQMVDVVKGPLATQITQSISGVGNERDLESFNALPHRFATVLKTKQWWVINDSKATNLASSQYALEKITSLNQKIFFICGGILKENVCSSWLHEVAKDHVLPICIGDCAKLLHQNFQKGLIADNFSHALEWIKQQHGGIILFSPGCSSFDMFKNYIDRGDQFVKEVRRVFEVR